MPPTSPVSSNPVNDGSGSQSGSPGRPHDRVPGGRNVKKMLAFPIGERFALISITAALFSARVTLTALLVWGGLAAAYTLTGRILRSIAR